MKRLVLLDGHALLFRAFHAMPGFTAPDGRPSGAVYGFSNVVVRILRELEPSWVITCFDSAGPTFRDLLYADYKATRSETPEDLRTQEPLVREALDKFAIPHIALSGFEADDLIATLVAQALQKSEIRNPKSETEVDEIVVVTGDRDLLQLADHKVKVYLLRQGIKEIQLLDGEAVSELIGVTPVQIREWKALVGDPSDNIIGVPGVGPKTATGLIQEFGNLETLYKEVRSPKSEVRIKDSLREKLLAHEERVFANRRLLELRTDAPIVLDLSAATGATYDVRTAREFLGSLGFHGILARLPATRSSSSRVKEPVDETPHDSVQGSLF